MPLLSALRLFAKALYMSSTEHHCCFAWPSVYVIGRLFLFLKPLSLTYFQIIEVSLRYGKELENSGSPVARWVWSKLCVM